MPIRDYSNSKIYKLCTDIDPYFYIGSTTNALIRRLVGHRAKAKHFTHRKIYNHFNELGFENVKIVLIEKVSVKNLDELLQVENYHIRSHINDEHCLNCNRALRSKQEYYEDNREILQENHKQYYEVNKESIRENHKQYRMDNQERSAERNHHYYENNKERIKVRSKQYREDNKERIREHNKQYYKHNKKLIMCPICGIEVEQYSYKKHEKSKRHKLNLQEVKSI